MDTNRENGIEYFIASVQSMGGHCDEQAVCGREPLFRRVERRQP
jgi:hypothetical protein